MNNIVMLVQLMGACSRAMLLTALNILLIGSVGVGAAYAASLQTQGKVAQLALQKPPVQSAGVAPDLLNKSVDLAKFQQAIADDLSGRPSEARSGYDALKQTEMAAQIAVPSAINLVVLGRLDEAKLAFSGIALSKDSHESSYAQLWLLWLTARENSGKATLLRQQLGEMARGFQMALPYQQAIVDLYAGRGNVDEVFKAIDAMPGNDELQRRNALTEATFFAGGYLQYVKSNGNAALQLYQREQSHLNSTSLELPLIKKATATLMAVKH